MRNSNYISVPLTELPIEKNWLYEQPCPVIVVGEERSQSDYSDVDNADVIVANTGELDGVIKSIEQSPMAAMALVQVLRSVEQMPIQQALTMESMAYATLQAGGEHKAWLKKREQAPELQSDSLTPAILTAREGDTVTAKLNRPQWRNSISVEMRDALHELLELVCLDESIERLELSGEGKCFSVGGELCEFGLAPDVLAAHWVRTTHSPSRLIARCADRVHCYLHGACIGSGIEIPAFAKHISAARNSYFQLPEINMGLIPGAGGCVSVSQRIGRQQTAWLALTGRKIKAATALEWGLVDELFDAVI